MSKTSIPEVTDKMVRAALVCYWGEGFSKNGVAMWDDFQEFEDMRAAIVAALGASDD